MNPRKKKAVAFRPAVDDARLEARALLTTGPAQVARITTQQVRLVNDTINGVIQGRYTLAANNATARIVSTGTNTLRVLGAVTVDSTVRLAVQAGRRVLTGDIVLKKGTSTLVLRITTALPTPGGAAVRSSNVRIVQATGTFRQITQRATPAPLAVVTLGTLQPNRTGTFRLQVGVPVRRPA